MKICPTCRKTYSDDGLNFCLEDGSVLNFAPSDPPETVMMGQPRPTDPSPFVSPASGVQTSWGNQPQYSMQPKKSSKTWVWVLLIVGGLILLCGGGFAGLIALAVWSDNNKNSEIASVNNSSDERTGPTSTPPPFTTDDVQPIDLSGWAKDVSVWGTKEYSGGEFIMASRNKGYYYVLVAPDDYKTENSITRVTVRNIDNAASALGYGLIVHSDPTPLTNDIAFLIDSKSKRYRVAKHTPGNEKNLVPWTSSPLIREGSQENRLEVRDKGASIEFYINGQMATSVKNTGGPKSGAPGLYSGDAVKAAFKGMEIAK